jgi:alpha-tubulin suppressor-like RCC1 family protein
MSEIKVNKIKPALNPVKITIDSGIAVNDETRLSDRQQSFGVKENGQIQLFAPLNVGSLAQTSSGNLNQILISRGPYLPPKWSDVPSVNCPALPTLGSTWAIGSNYSYQLGRGVGAQQNWSTLANGGYSTILAQVGIGTSLGPYKNWKIICESGPMAIQDDGTLWAWGDYSAGQLGSGQGIWTNQSSQISGSSWDAPIQESSLSTNWTSVTRSLNTSLGLKSDGTLWVWGANQFGEFGNSSLPLNIGWQSKEPVRIGTDTNWKFLSPVSTRAIKTNGTLWAWGYNSIFYECGISTTTQLIRTPTQVGTDTDWVYVSETKGIKTDGSLWSWGSVNQMGDGRTSGIQSTPKKIDAGMWKKVVEGTGVVFALKQDGTLWAWGSNSSGEYLGLGSSYAQNFIVRTPTQIGTDTDWLDVVANEFGAWVLKSNGTLWLIGRGTERGEFGKPSIIYYTPTIAPYGQSILWTKIGSGERAFYGIGEEVLVAPQNTVAQWLRSGYTSLRSTACGNGTSIDTPPDPPTGWVYCDGRNGIQNMKNFVNPNTLKLDWPPVDNNDGCGNTPTNSNGLISGQLTYIQKV